MNDFQKYAAIKIAEDRAFVVHSNGVTERALAAIITATRGASS